MRQQLKLWLSINACFSGISGLTMIFFSDALQKIFGFTHPVVFPVVGLSLLLFSASLLYVTRYQLDNPGKIMTISLMDGLWVLGSLVIIIFQLFDLTRTGYFLMLITAIFVGLFGMMQYRCLIAHRKLPRARSV